MSRLSPLLLMLLLTIAPASAAEKVRLFAAASMTNALQEAVADFEASNNIEVTTVYAASSALARQISRGAPADIYISANRKWMDYLQQQGVVDDSRHTTLLYNQLVLIAGRQYDGHLITPSADMDLAALLDGGRLAMADPAHVPAGIYARQALQSLTLWQQAAPLITRSHNVRSALLLVERGETPLGIVYKTDALASRGVRIVAEFDSGSHDPIEYPLALLNDAAQKTPAQKLFRYLQSAPASVIFQRHGFGTTQ